jgi:hypothetical protein
VSNIFEEMLGGAGKGKATPDLTSERIADAVELSAAIAALEFYEERGTSTGVEVRLKKLVGEFTARMCRRHGA